MQIYLFVESQLILVLELRCNVNLLTICSWN